MVVTRIVIRVLFVLGTLSFSALAFADEAEQNEFFCSSVGGQTESRHYYSFLDQRKYIKIDCETATHVYEGGLDGRSSLDSIQQAVFFGILTKKIPAVVIYDTDGKLGAYEYRISQSCNALGIMFLRIDARRAP